MKSTATSLIHGPEILFQETLDPLNELLKDIGLAARQSIPFIGMVSASVILGLWIAGWSS
jgi:hypothetical protein